MVERHAYQRKECEERDRGLQKMVCEGLSVNSLVLKMGTVRHNKHLGHVQGQQLASHKVSGEPRLSGFPVCVLLLSGPVSDS